MNEPKNPFYSSNSTDNSQSSRRCNYRYIAPVRASHIPRTSYVIVAIIGVLLVAVIGVCAYAAIDYGTRKSLSADCLAVQDDVQLMQDRLRQLMSSQKDIISLTEDQVQDKSTLQALSKQVSSAKELIRSTNTNCSFDQSAKALNKAKANATTAYSKLEQTYSNLDKDLQAAKASHKAKELEDAKDALKSTLESAEAVATKLINTGSISLASKLNAIISRAQQLVNSDDVDQMKLTRNSLEDVIDRINDSLSVSSAYVNKIEDNVKRIVNQVGSDGTYKDSAMQIIHAAGLTEVWGLAKMQGACAITSEQEQSWVGAFCTGSPSKVYISDQRQPEEYQDVYFADAMRHEVAHYLIYRRCNTTSPAVIVRSGVDTEAATSAYAVLYLNANDRTLNRANDSRYHMSASAYSAAAKIHSGQCN